MIKLNLEVASTPVSMAKGLMHRYSLSPNQGMLFKFPSSLEASFWGKDTYIPLDVAFIDKGVITEIKNITPMSTRTVRSTGLCQMAIEANAGFFQQNGIRPGYLVKFNKTNDMESEVIFIQESK